MPKPKKSSSKSQALNELLSAVEEKEDLLVPFSEIKEKTNPASQKDQAENSSGSTVQLADLIRHLSLLLEKSRIADYVLWQQKPFRLFFHNLLIGLTRGLGFIFGVIIFLLIIMYFFYGDISLNNLGTLLTKLISIVKAFIS